MSEKFKWLSWSSRLSDARPAHSGAHDTIGVPSPAQLERALESDRGRIVNSAAVRRLQQKTQVFPLERNAAVRSRLTHSLEVQQVGRFITRTLFTRLSAQQLEQTGLGGYERAVESAVEMACLMHDIGNPPFGHFGEAAISKWFGQHAAAFPGFQHPHPLRDAYLQELRQFEGNAQGIRIVTSLQRLNLTFMQTACILKYTRKANEPPPPDDHPLSYLHKKPGYYQAEAPYVERLFAQLDLAPGARFPLTYLMEAADDISYCLADIEDGVDKGLLSVDTLCPILKAAFDDAHRHAACFNGMTFFEVIDEAHRKYALEPINKDHEFFVTLRVILTHALVDHAATRCVEHLNSIGTGTFNGALLEGGSTASAVVQTLKRVARAHIFCVPEVQTLELQGYRIICGLLDIFAPLLHLDLAQFDALFEGQGLLPESRLLARHPNKHLAAYRDLRQQKHNDPELWEQYARCRLIQDMVSGMTDHFALEEYRTLTVQSY